VSALLSLLGAVAAVALKPRPQPSAELEPAAVNIAA
jgi:hypothetical protein